MVHLLSLALYIVFIVFTRLGEEFKKTFNIFVHRLSVLLFKQLSVMRSH